MKTKTFMHEPRQKMDAYWRVSGYLSDGQIYLYDKSPA
jgi:phosphoketolase